MIWIAEIYYVENNETVVFACATEEFAIREAYAEMQQSCEDRGIEVSRDYDEMIGKCWDFLGVKVYSVNLISE